MPGTVIMLSGPIGAGKTTVAEELVAMWTTPLANIEGDAFWPFFARPSSTDRGDAFRVLLRSMTAASIPFARSGYDVILDFSTPPGFRAAARMIIKDIPLAFIVLRPPIAVCAARAAARKSGKIKQYDAAFYAMFDCEARHVIAEDTDARATAARIMAGVAAGEFLVGP